MQDLTKEIKNLLRNEIDFFITPPVFSQCSDLKNFPENFL